jgi:predicted RNA methylase
VFLLAVETGLLPYEKVEEIIESVGAWKDSNKFVKQIMEYDRIKKYKSSLWLIPKDLYLSSDYYKNNFTKKEANNQYDRMVYKYSVEDDRQLREFLEKGIVKLKDIEARLNEANIKTDIYINKLRGYAKKVSSKNKLKALKLILEGDSPDKNDTNDLTDSELLKHVTNNGLEMIKKAENQGGVLINRKRLVENATKISQLTWMKGLKKDKGLPLEAVAEAIQYEVGYNDNWNDLKNSIEKGGYEINRENVERIKSVGIELPFETYEMFDAKMQQHKAEHERKKALFPENQRKFVDKLIKDNYADVKYNKVKLEKLANEFGIKEQNLAKELAELSISFLARVYAHDIELTTKQRYEKIVKLYDNQVNLSHRTSESIMLQQYSTPAPIGYLAGLFCGFDKEGGNYFEPSAGNGLLTIAGKTKDFTVNEIDTVRNRNLNALGFKELLKQDASEPFKQFEHKFDGVITNPPFGKTEVVTYGKSDIKSLEQVMSLRALDTMKDNGRCAIIIGGHTEYDKEGRIQSGKNRTYFVYLYKHYNVMDVINISGRHLYSRQGTAFNTRLILIDGRKETPSGFPPLIENPIPMNEINSPTPVDNFDVLWQRINKSI